MNENETSLNELSINLPEALMSELEAEQPVYGLESGEDCGVPDFDPDHPEDYMSESDFEKGFMVALSCLKEKDSKDRAKGSKIQKQLKAKGKVKVKPSIDAKGPESIAKTKKDKSISSKDKLSKIDPSKVTSDTGKFVWNKKIQRYETFVEVEGKNVKVYDSRGIKNAEVYMNRPGRGKILKDCNIHKLQVFSEDGSTFMVTRGSAVPKVKKETKITRKVKKETKSKKVSEKIPEIPAVVEEITLIGSGKLEGATKIGKVVSRDSGRVVVEVSTKSCKVPLTYVFSAKTGKEVGGQSNFGWRIS